MRFRDFTAATLATALGAGLSPIAPGTMGTLVAVPLAFATADWNAPPRAALWLALLITGTWAAGRYCETSGKADDQRVVIDEVVGYGITAWTAGAHWPALIAAFVAFRFFDILKPWPIRVLDRWSKNHAMRQSPTVARWVGGFGVMADDILAGLLGLLAIVVLQRLHALP